MNKQTNYVFFSLFFLLVSLIFVQKYDYLNSSRAYILVPIAIFLILFTDVVILMSRDTRSALFFGKIIFLVVFYFILSLLPILCRSLILAFIISYLPYLLYRFYVLFSGMDSSKKTKIMSYFSLGLSTLCMSLLLVDFTTFYWIVLFDIITNLLFCLLSYINEKDHLSLKTCKELSILVQSFIVAFTPFILSYSVFIHISSSVPLLYSLIFILILPITVGFILIRRKEICIDLLTIFISIMAITLSICLFLGINHFFLQLSKTKLLFVLIFCLLLLYIIYLKNTYLNKVKVRKIQQSKNAFQKERIGLIQRITKEEFLSSTSTLISKLLLELYEIDSHLVIWNELNHPYILSNTGVFAQISLTNDLLSEINNDQPYIHLKHFAYSKFSLGFKNNPLGWLIIGNKEDAKLTLTEHEIIKEFSLSLGEIIHINEQLYNTNHEVVSIEGFNYDDYIHYEYLNMVQKFHKEFSIYIHDSILQDFLALKKLTESLSTKQIETKNLILETYDSLNKTLRDKMFSLYPSTLETASLSQNLEILCSKINRSQQEITVNFDCPVALSPKKELKFHLYRITQELLTNAIKHSQAKKIQVSLLQVNTEIQSIVQDDGIGFDFEEMKSNKFCADHFGLLSIYQEINSLNGEFKIFSVTPSGTKIIVSIPMAKEDD